MATSPTVQTGTSVMSQQALPSRDVVRLFVYGTLMPQAQNAQVLAQFQPEDWQPAWLPQHLGWELRWAKHRRWPYLCPTRNPFQAQEVRGCCCMIAQNALSVLDEFEDVPQAYERQTLLVMTDQGPVQASAYVASAIIMQSPATMLAEEVPDGDWLTASQSMSM